MSLRPCALAALISTLPHAALADIPLLGCNLPHESLNDGDFEQVRATWRQFKQSPCWTARHLPGKGSKPVGIDLGKIFGGGNDAVEFHSVPLTGQDSAYPKPVPGDVLQWSFAARAEYPCDSRVSMALMFGETASVVADRKPVPGGKVDNAVFTGRHTITDEDAKSGALGVRLTLHSSEDTKVYVDHVDLKVLRPDTAGPDSLTAEPVDAGIALHWSGSSPDARYNVYRSSSPRKDFKPIATGISGTGFTDSRIINGLTNHYIVTRAGENESSASPVVSSRKTDTKPPLAPSNLKASGGDTVIHLTWNSADDDIASYNIFRGDAQGNHMTRIAKGIKPRAYEDMLPIKGARNTYSVQAVDHSGNTGTVSETIGASVKAVPGASFSDLILPMPIHKALRSDLWGADDVLPRDPTNGVESPEWTYWGGRVVKDAHDGKYHIINTRWPESARKGHWEWPNSTVAHLVSDQPTGPYSVRDEIAYTYQNGLGHNPSVIRLRDGRYMLYSLVHFKPMIFTSASMNGPWKLEGELTVEENDTNYDRARDYQYTRNLCFVERPDGAMLVVSKFGAMMLSETGLLGPYKVLTRSVHHNPTIPDQYRKSNYEDPALWYDGVQYHMLINAFLDYRAIYLRSPDGIRWHYETGLAFTPGVAVHEDGTRNLWDKVERPHVLVDEFGRATHLSLAASDSPKEDDYGNDKHSAKNLILPLVVYKRIEVLDTTRLLVHSEPGFNASTDLDLDTLRYGSPDEVNFGRGGKITRTEPHANGLILEFAATDSGITANDFAGKLIGRSNSGSLVVGYTKLNTGYSQQARPARVTAPTP